MLAWGRLDHRVLPSADSCYMQAYPEYARALMENAPEGFNAAVSAWEKRHGKVPWPWPWPWYIALTEVRHIYNQ